MKTTGTNIVLKPLASDSKLTVRGEVLSVGNEVLSVSKGDIVHYNPRTIPGTTAKSVPYVLIDFGDILNIEV